MLYSMARSAVDCRICSDGCVPASHAENEFVWRRSTGESGSERVIGIQYVVGLWLSLWNISH